MLCCIDSLTSENFQMADRVWNRPIMHCKPLVIDYVMYALIVCILLLTWKGLFIPDLRTSIWRPDICNYYLLAPFLKNWPRKEVFRGHFGPQSKIFWLKNWLLMKMPFCATYGSPYICMSIDPRRSKHYKSCSFEIKSMQPRLQIYVTIDHCLLVIICQTYCVKNYN